MTPDFVLMCLMGVLASAPRATRAKMPAMKATLAELDGVREHGRNAEFQCVACFVYSEDAEPLLANGRWRGRILKARSGNGGFGYDPVFFDPELGKSAAELTADEKNASSHRGKALRALADLLGATPA
jgi:XTP/dITP diphosphohydrolase